MDTTFIISVIAATLLVSTPILLAALGETINERAGILNLGIEGTMVCAAFIGFWAAKATNSVEVGLLAGLLAGAALGLLMAFLTVTLGLSQHVSGLGVTLLGTGLALFLYRLAFPDPKLPPKLDAPFPMLSIFSGTPLEPIFSQYALTYLAVLLVPICWWLLYRTGIGLNMRAVGENPEAADTAGVNVLRVRYAALIAGGALMGAGGAFLSLAQLGSFTYGIVAGRGWVAIALVIFGNWNPVRVLVGALLFAVFQALQLRWQAQGVDLPYWFLLALPYLVTILALTLAGRNASYPAALLKPYKREG
ncbi:MAG: ABC transporter permease [Anaerolineae bacterium]|nr:ABC transporter permease [Anaerolineae bacterium]